jgi:hypothetical protein
MSIISIFPFLSFPKTVLKIIPQTHFMVYRSYCHQYANTGRHTSNLLVSVELINKKPP